MEVRAPGAAGSWTLITPNTDLEFEQDLNQLQWMTVNLPLLSVGEEVLVVEGNDIRALAGGTERWYGQIRRVNEDPYLATWEVRALGKEVLARDRAWASRREWVNLPPEVIVDEVLGNVIDEELRAGLQVHYDMEKLTLGGLMEDLSGNGNDGTITGPTSVVAKWGLGRTYAAEGDEIVITGYNYDGFTAFGHGAHVRIANAFAGRQNQTIYGAHTAGTNAQGTIRLRSPSAGGLPDQAQVFINTATEGFQVPGFPFTFVLGQVYHIFATWDGSFVRMYVDGVQIGTDRAASGALVSGPPSHFVGHVAGPTFDTETFHDFIDNVTSYDRAPSAAQVRALAGRSIYEGGLLADSFDPISFRAEEDTRLNVVDGVVKAIGGDWYTDRDGDDRDRFRLEARRGSASATDTFALGTSVVGIEHEELRDTIRNDVIALGYGDAVNQLRSRIWHGTTIRDSLSAAMTDSQTTIDLVSASGFPTGGGIVFVGAERCLYTGITANQLTGVTRDYVADGYESLAAYAHSAGIAVWLHADTTTTPDTYYDPSSPQTGSSIQVNGHKQGEPVVDRGIIDQDTLDRLAQRLLETYREPRDTVWLEVAEEDIVAALGDDVDLEDSVAAPLWASPYRLFSLNFRREDSTWKLELGGPRDVREAELAQLREEMRLSRSYGQGSVTGYHTQMAENIEGGQRDMLMDLTISDLAVAINRVTIERLRLRAFEKYTGVAAGSQAPTSSGGVAHGHPITGQATEDESAHVHAIPQTDINVAEVEDVSADSVFASCGINSWFQLGQGITLASAAQYAHATMLAQLFEDARKGRARFRLRKEPISWTSIRAMWPMDLSNPTASPVNLNPTTFFDIVRDNHLTVQSSGQFITVRDAPSVVDSALADVGQSCLNFDTPLSYPHHLSRSTGDAGGIDFINDNTGTLSFWVRMDAVTAQQTLFSVAEEGASGDEWNLSHRGDLNNELQITLRINGSTTVELRSPTNTINDTDWHHVVVTSNGSTSALYVDDASQSLTVVTGSNNGPWFGDATDADVISWGIIRRASLTRPLDGGIDDAYIFNRVITSAERTAVFTEDAYFPRGTGMPFDPSVFSEMDMRTDLAVDMGTSAELLVKVPAETDREYSYDIFWDPISADPGGLITISGQLVLVSYTDSFPAAAGQAGSAHSHSITGQATDTEATHTHDVTIAAHSHPSDLVEDPYVTPSVGIKIDGTDRTAALGGPWTGDQSDLDITEFVSATGVHTLEFFENAAGKVGRIHASVYVEIFLRGSRPG